MSMEHGRVARFPVLDVIGLRNIYCQKPRRPAARHARAGQSRDAACRMARRPAARNGRIDAFTKLHDSLGRRHTLNTKWAESAAVETHPIPIRGDRAYRRATRAAPSPTLRGTYMWTGAVEARREARRRPTWRRADGRLGSSDGAPESTTSCKYRPSIHHQASSARPPQSFETVRISPLAPGWASP